MILKYIKNILLLLCTAFYVGIVHSQPQKIKAEELKDLNNWCSDKKAFKTSELSEKQQVKSSCWPKPLRYGKWFTVLANSQSLEVTVKMEKDYGTMVFPYIGMWRADNFREVGCKKYLDDTDDLVLSTNNLEEGVRYFVGVFNHNMSKYQGSFSLCLNDEITNDFIAGATELLHQDQWCSPGGEYSTIEATPDGPKPSCLNNGPNFNKWFKFKATASYVNLTVKYGGISGDAQFPYLALWDEQMNELDCSHYVDEQTPISVNYDQLVPGKWYYISVDHKYNIRYPGTFSLCMEKTKDTDEIKKNVIIGKLRNSIQQPLIAQKILLLDAEANTLKETQTDAKGKFRFERLSPDKSFVVKVEEKNPDMVIDILQMNEEGEIIKQTVKDDRGNYGFEDLPTKYNNIILIDLQNVDLKIKEGTHAIIGKVVDKQEPIDEVSNLMVYLYTTPRKLLDSTVTDIVGTFKFLELSVQKTYMIKLQKTDFEKYAEMFLLNNDGNPIMSSSSREKDNNGFFYFEKLPAIKAESLPLMEEEDTDFSNLQQGKVIKLKNIYFDYGEHELLKSSHKELDRLVGILNETPELKIEIGGHTDNLGSKEKNMKLSEKRAKSVVEYLIQKGIDRSRLSYKGYGGLQPIADNNTEEGRQANRRVEFKIIE